MKHRSVGFINPLLAVSTVGLLALVAAVIVINPSLPSPFSQASVTRRNIRLVQNSYDARFVKNSDGSVNKRKVNLTGDFCFASHLQTGSENWTIWASRDSAGRDRFTQAGSSADIDNGKLDAGGGYPAPCEGFDPQTGEAELRNLGSLQSHTFSLQLMFPQDLSAVNCPDVLLNYESNRQGGRAFGRIPLKNITGLCSPVTTQIPTPGPTSASTPASTSTPAPTRPPANNTAITGTIRVYSCTKPDHVELYRCGAVGESQDKCSSLFYDTNSPTTEADNHIWLDDTNTDNTWLYRYRITKDTSDTALVAGKTYRLGKSDSETPAYAVFGSKKVGNAPEPLDQLRVTAGGVRDFAIDAKENCGCSFHATAYIKDEQNRPISKLDNKSDQWGVSNEKYRTQRADIPNKTFPFGHNGKFGQIEYGPADLDTLNPLGFGHDTLATVKLFVPDNFSVLRQECTSKGAVDACPANLPKNTFSDTDKPREINGLRVTCGADLEYGWILKENPITPTPIQSGSGDMEVRVVIYNKNAHSSKYFWPQSSPASSEPKSCERLNTPQNPNAQERPLYLSSFKIKARCVSCEGDVEFKETAEKREGYLSFHNIPPGEYSLSIERVQDRGFSITPICENKRWTVLPGGTVGNNRTHTRAYIILQNDADNEYDREETEQICKNQTGIPNIIEGLRGNYCYYPSGKHEGGSGGGEGGGSGAGECWPPNKLKCTGPVSGDFGSPGAVCSFKGQDDAGNTYTSGFGWCGEGNNACCYINGTGGDTGGGGGGGTGGTGGGTPACSGSYSDFARCDSACSPTGGYCSSSGNIWQCCGGSGGTGGGGTEPSPTPNPELGQCTTKSTQTIQVDGPVYAAWICQELPALIRTEPSTNGGYCCVRQKPSTTPSPTARPTPTPTTEPGRITIDINMVNANAFGTLHLEPTLCNSGKCRDLQKYSVRLAFGEPNRIEVSLVVDKDVSGEPLTASNEYVISCRLKYDVFGPDKIKFCDPKKVKGKSHLGIIASVNQSGIVGLAFNIMSQGFSADSFSNAQADLNADGVINSFDYAILLENYGLATQGFSGQNPVGDINQDGVVNALDVSYIIELFGEKVN